MPYIYIYIIKTCVLVWYYLKTGLKMEHGTVIHLHCTIRLLKLAAVGSYQFNLLLHLLQHLSHLCIYTFYLEDQYGVFSVATSSSKSNLYSLMFLIILRFSTQQFPHDSHRCFAYHGFHHIGLVVPQSLDCVENIYNVLLLDHLSDATDGTECTATAPTSPVGRWNRES